MPIVHLPYKARCLSNVSNFLPKPSYNLHYFLLSSDIPFGENEIHLIEYDDTSFSIRNVEIFEHKDEIDHMVCLGMHEKKQGEKKVILCTSGFQSFDVSNGTEQMKYTCSLWQGCVNNMEGKYSDDVVVRRDPQVEEADTKIDDEVDTKIDDEVDTKTGDEASANVGDEAGANVGDEAGANVGDEASANVGDEENEVDSSFRMNGNVKRKYVCGEGKKKEPLENMCELKSSEEYVRIKNIAVDDYESEFRKIAIIDKYHYTIFEKNKNDINYILSKNVEKELNYGVFDPHHENILTVISDIHFYGYDIRNNKEIFSTYTNHKANLSSIDFNTNIPNVVITSSNDGYIKFWDLRFIKTDFFTLNIHSHWITSAHFNNFHDELLLTTSTDNTVKLHKIEYSSNLNLQKKETNYELIKTYKDHEESVYHGAWSKTDAWVFASLSYDGRCVVNSVPTEQKYKILL
ncbi:protein TSSC1, putative [Plasmodium ovale wallikeri]|uniref:Protein TSSC1, putative n=1 Tax=Plasmodium ovale wallikeri TaxID=864142 RepID=A0A1A8ZXW7_PLAOA|nr:protein TSSC1, putative [Plasmodium ovale wallikeri]SBT49179.1 protein TSSC1, putative [Plasmodium ovale wallikeri]